MPKHCRIWHFFKFLNQIWPKVTVIVTLHEQTADPQEPGNRVDHHHAARLPPVTAPRNHDPPRPVLVVRVVEPVRRELREEPEERGDEEFGDDFSSGVTKFW